MNLLECAIKLKTSINPVACNLVSGNKCKVLCLLFTAGMNLKAHKSNVDAELYVLDGCVQYKDDTRSVLLSMYEKIDIAPGQIHTIECIEDAKCLLIQNL